MYFEKDEKEERKRKKREKKRLKKEKKNRKKERKHDHDDKKRRRSSSSSSSSSDEDDNKKYKQHKNMNDNHNDNVTNSNTSLSNNNDNNDNNNNEKYAINEVKEIIPSEGTTKIVTKSKLDFFSSLIANELNAPQIGTIHAKGKTDNNDNKERSRGWICPKCDTSNATFNLQCSKCRAMKRFESTHRSER